MRSFLLFPFLLVSVLISAEEEEVTDYFESEWSHLKRVAGGKGEKTDGALNFRIMSIEKPDAVSPDEFVVLKVNWEKTQGPEMAICYMDAFGNWAPEEPLDANPVGPAGPDNVPMVTEIRFKAPSQTGSYTVRWLLTPGFYGQESYYGRRDIGMEMPGRAFWAEIPLVVEASPE
jgi:hypothetical protein